MKQQVVPTYKWSDDFKNKPTRVVEIMTESGYFTTTAWKIATNALLEVLPKWKEGDPKYLLFADNLGIHSRDEDAVTLLRKGIRQLFFPPNCSQYIQPLDNIVFANFKTALATRANDAAFVNSVAKDDNGLNLILAVLVESIEAAFSKKNIQLAFKNVGLFSFDETVIYGNSQKAKSKQVLKNNSESGSTGIVHTIVKQTAAVMKGLLEEHKDNKKKTNKVTISTKYPAHLDAVKIEDAINNASMELEMKEAVAMDIKSEAAKKSADSAASKLKEKETNLAMKRTASIDTFALKCKFIGCPISWKEDHGKSGEFIFCSHCDKFCLCYRHSEDAAGKVIMKVHETECKKPGAMEFRYFPEEFPQVPTKKSKK